jgi:uncharacterized protein with von Willebrand factor type A (vWA) domain
MSGDLANSAAVLGGRLAKFPTFLRSNGFGVGASAGVDSLRVANLVGVTQKDSLRWSLKALLCNRAEEWGRFDRLFDSWFLPANQWQQAAAREVEKGFFSGNDPAGDSTSTRDSDELEDATPRNAASDKDISTRGDFKDLMKREHLLELEAVVRQIAKELRQITLRREAASSKRKRLNMQATARGSVATGGLPLRLHWKNRKKVKPRLILIIDVSRSMIAYSFFYLRLARALAAVIPDVHTFIFHTTLIGVSQALRDPDPTRAQQRLHVLAEGWASGTRIGESLNHFIKEYAGGLINSRTGIVILSDGYETGSPESLGAALRYLKRRVRRLVWLNPLLSKETYQPVSAGIKAALPLIDLHAAAGDLKSLKITLPSLLGALR